MYLSRTNSLIDVLLYLLLSSGWAVGGWLLVTHAFRLHRLERMVSGLAVGFLLFISLSNLAAHFLPLTLAFLGASLMILLAGAACAWHSRLATVVGERRLARHPSTGWLGGLHRSLYIDLAR